MGVLTPGVVLARAEAPASTTSSPSTAAPRGRCVHPRIAPIPALAGLPGPVALPDDHLN